MDSAFLFQKICEMSGVSAVLAPGMVRRSLVDGGAHPDTATAEDYRRALPRLTARLKAYMSEDEAARRHRRIQGFLAHADGELDSEDESDWSLFGRVHELLREGTPAAGVAPMRVTPGGDAPASRSRSSEPRDEPSAERAIDHDTLRDTKTGKR